MNGRPSRPATSAAVRTGRRGWSSSVDSASLRSTEPSGAMITRWNRPNSRSGRSPRGCGGGWLGIGGLSRGAWAAARSCWSTRSTRCPRSSRTANTPVTAIATVTSSRLPATNRAHSGTLLMMGPCS
ncbi:hypothetical protein OIE66_23115 [Nonomuraea sp. NBC_01738]|uniref:hypothetical protein n=1 Tax=Nonomuraea sp. NBC_01738 TaxID=2976003 RepID=UPI002E120CFD|nr:hypothetical protein OIE66_23115 [Nonomuraea sp. NBC_01738]